MRAGRLRHTVTIEKIVETQDAFGAIVKDWKPFLTEIKAAIEPINGKELFTLDSRHAEVTTRFRIRYSAGVTNKMRVKFGARYYDIDSVILPEEKKGNELILMAVEQVD